MGGGEFSSSKVAHSVEVYCEGRLAGGADAALHVD